MRVWRSRVFAVCIASAVTAIVVGGVAWAIQSPVDGNGVIHACYNPHNGDLRLNIKGSCPTRGAKHAAHMGRGRTTGTEGRPRPARSYGSGARERTVAAHRDAALVWRRDII